MNTRERMKKYLQYKNISEGSFEKLAGLSKGFISSIGDSIRATKSISDNDNDSLCDYITYLLPMSTHGGSMKVTELYIHDDYSTSKAHKSLVCG